MRLNLYARLAKIQSRTRKQIDSFLYNAPNRYKVYSIPKRNGGERTIAHPSHELKNFQYNLIEILEPIFKIHPNALAYRKGLGIKQNASLHSQNSYILKIDFSDFFNSITPDLLFKAFAKNKFDLSSAEERVLTKGLFWNKAKSQSTRLSLSVGAPSSPLISNIIMYYFDETFTNICNQKGITYTRYADDLTFSTNKKNALFTLPDEIRTFLNKEYGNLITLNERKTVFTSKAHNRHITGVTITTKGSLSIGRERKRLISSLIHKYTLNLLTLDMTYYLQGLLSFAIHIEPDFRDRMTKKYSSNVITELIKLRKEDGTYWE
ncbi:retron St85 family RNA-directed DNA polymerase [Providencia huaxiensis]|uniref:retron St85 family RNA-directed DNA polymerase n=1 Tax=Providencia huaxiensis TaxID=2027290 RepID=UPI001EFCE3F1|nr:retron St85 family RNA-directed DNA polymerase [Providencia huaxiensis]MCG9536667.1 retron St85 family RNA-directed DNA polymerase [Providencia huaxiensis]